MSDSTSAHVDICIPFEIAGQQFEAVGFLKAGEASCLGEEALKRTDNGHLVREEPDWSLLYEHRAQLPAELRQYFLVTARPDPAGPRGVLNFHFDSGGWYGCGRSRVVRWDQDSLVVRRRVS